MASAGANTYTRFRALTSAVATRWPEAPLYGGQFEDVVPHLTVAVGQEPGLLDQIEADLSPRLPVRARVFAVQLLAFTGEQWIEEELFELRRFDGPPPAAPPPAAPPLAAAGS